MNLSRRAFVSTGAALLAASALNPLQALAKYRDYPTKPVRLIVPYPPGAASDTLGRLAADVLGKELGQTFVVDNRGGGGTVIGTRAVATAAPDGYTLGFIDTAFVTNPGLLGKQLPYDPSKDFAPITQICTAPFVMVVHPSVNAKTLKEFVALAKAKPGSLAYGSSGVGSAPHLAGQQLRQEAGIEIVHVPYRGGSTVYTDLLGGQVQFSFGTVPSLIEYIKAGRMRALAITSAHRIPELPDVPTMTEQGFPGVNTSPVFGLVAPARTSSDIVHQVASIIAASTRNGSLNDRLKHLGFIPVGSTSEQFSSVLARQISEWKTVIQKAGIKPD
jgi:tripartite-type tricarboxylate transporter receptor subunit TctC